MNVIDGAVSTSMRSQLSIALVTIMKDQFEQLNKIGAAATTIGVDEEAAKNRNFEIVCQMPVKLNRVDGPTRLLRFVTRLCICRNLLFCFRYLVLSLRRV